MKKVIIMTIFLLSTLLIITACSTEKIIDDPEISIRFNVSNLTDEEFQCVGTKELESASKEDFKNIEFTLDEKNSDGISNRKIMIPEFKKVANSFDRERYWFGQSSTEDSSANKFAKYSYKFLFYSKGLNEQDIENIFSSSEVKISWTTNDGKNEEQVNKLGEIIQFQS